MGGCSVEKFTAEQEPQLDMFTNRDPSHIPLMQAVDRLNLLYGMKVRLASQDSGRIRKMKQEMFSPRYYTNLDEEIIIMV